MYAAARAGLYNAAEAYLNTQSVNFNLEGNGNSGTGP